VFKKYALIIKQELNKIAMSNIKRRRFIKKVILYNTSALFGASFLAACNKDGFGESITKSFRSDWTGKELEYLPIQNDNPSISLLMKRCEKCGDCLEACAEKQKVFGTYQASPSKHVCIHCGSCISSCEEGALIEKYHWQEVLAAINDPSKTVIASISPAVRVGIGDYFGMAAGAFLLDNLVGACRAAGFDYVLDTNFSADLTIMEEAAELVTRIQDKTGIPQFTSCCPAWVKFVEIYYPSLLGNLSTVKSPISMQGAMAKSYFAQKMGIDPRNIVHVAIAPCTAKKFEITREELTTDEIPNNDLVITTNELAKLLKNLNISLAGQTGRFDSLMGAASGGAMIFGNTGGVMRAALRTAYFSLTGKNPPASLLELKQVQGLSGLREAQVTIGSTTLKVAVCYEMRNAQRLLDQVRSGTCRYDFIEVMACKGGCVGGAGQPTSGDKLEKRIRALNTADTRASTRYCHENPEIKAVYRDFLGEAGGEKAKKYLHTTYNDKSGLL
jgi:ferredoxin hydrogenase